MDLIERRQFNDNRHPWEISRRKSILRIIQNSKVSTQYADIGAGDLFFTGALIKYTNKPVYAVDKNYDFRKNENKIIKIKNISDIPKASVDCIFALDVLEHIGNETEFLESLKSLLKDKGTIIITVPAHQFLFSGHDVFLRHFRRYNHKKLLFILKKQGFVVNDFFYFYTSLFIIRFIQVLCKFFTSSTEMKYAVANWRFGSRSVITKCIENILDFEFLLSRYVKKFGILMPGLSLCLICEKKSV